MLPTTWEDLTLCLTSPSTDITHQFMSVRQSHLAYATISLLFFFFFSGPGQAEIPFHGSEPLRDEEINTLNKEGSSSYPQE